MDIMKIVSMIRATDISDELGDGKEKIIFGVDDKRIGHVDAYGNTKDITNIPSLTRKSETREGALYTEHTLTMTTDFELPFIVKMIRVNVNSDLPTNKTIPYMDSFPRNTRFIIGSQIYNNGTTELMINSTSKDNFIVQFNGGSGGEVFDIIAIGE